MVRTYDINAAHGNGRKEKLCFCKMLIWLCFIGILCVRQQSVEAAGIYTEPGIYQMSANWAYPVKCHTMAEENGDTLLLYSAAAEDNSQTIVIDRISHDGRQENVKKLSVPGKTWGGTVYHAPDGCYYITTGNDGQIAFYVMKYDAHWNLLGTASVTKEQSYVQSAFEAGNSDMTMAGDYLIVHAARKRKDGHQANTTIWINSKTMNPVYVPKEYGDTHVSHSFSQFVRYDGNRVIMIDQGDAYPRGICMTSQLPALSGKNTTKTLLMNFCLDGSVEETTDMSVLNYTGTTVDGFELGARHHLVVGASIPHDTFTSGQQYENYEGCNNIYTILVDKDLNSSTLKWLTSYPSDIRVRNVELIKVGDDRFLIVYGTGKETADGYTDTTHYMLIDSDGSVLRSGEIAKPFYGTSELSFDGAVLTWCHYAESELGRFIVMSRWNVDTGDFSVRNIETGTVSEISSLFPIKDIRNEYKTGEVAELELGVFSPVFEENFSPTAIAVWESSDPDVIEVLTDESALSKSVSSSSKYVQWYKTAASAFLAKGEGTATVTCKIGDKKWSAIFTVSPAEIEMTPTPYPVVVPSQVPTKNPTMSPVVSPTVTPILPTVTPSPMPAESRPPALNIQKPQTSDDGITTWDCVYFGSYWQNDTNGDGVADQDDAKQPIKWRVLSVDGEDVFLLADKNLDVQPYDETGEKVTWKTCTLRKWLNGAFFNQAFNTEEQAAVSSTVVENYDDSYYGTQGGGNTIDQVYLLSFDEAAYPFYGFTAVRDGTKTRESANTAYAKARGAYARENGNGYWWLRTQGISNGRASCVGADGDVDTFGELVDRGNNVVRPVLHLNLSRSSAWSPAGTVSSDGTAEELAPPFVPSPMPTVKPNPVPTETPSGPIVDTSTEKPDETEAPDVVRTPEPTEAPQSTPGQMPVQTPSPSQNVPSLHPSVPPLPVTNQPVANRKDEYDDDDFDSEEYDEDEYEGEWEKGDTFTAGNVRYKVTKRKGKKGEVAVAGVKSKKAKSIVIPKKVKKGGIAFVVTSIQNNAFRGCKKAKALTIRSTSIRTIAKKALNGMNKRIRIQLPKGKAKKYRKLLSKCGYRVIRS